MGTEPGAIRPGEAAAGRADRRRRRRAAGDPVEAQREHLSVWCSGLQRAATVREWEIRSLTLAALSRQRYSIMRNALALTRPGGAGPGPGRRPGRSRRR